MKSRREHGVTPATARSEEGRINSFSKEPGDLILDSWLPEPEENTFCYFMVVAAHIENEYWTILYLTCLTRQVSEQAPVL